mgnify:CR=1 FL=1
MKKNLKKILVGLVVVIVLAVIFLRGDQLEELVTTIERGAPLPHRRGCVPVGEILRSRSFFHLVLQIGWVAPQPQRRDKARFCNVLRRYGHSFVQYVGDFDRDR